MVNSPAALVSDGGDKQMSIHSTAFGVTKLTDKDSVKFRSQVAHGRISKAAVKSLKQGRALLKTLDKHGRVKVKAKKSK